jgi:molybdate transport system substrate-binding protein
MDKAVKLDLAAAEPKLFTANALTIAVPAGNPGGVNAFADLAKPGLRLVTCAEEVPCGALAAEAASQAGLELAPVSQEQNVKAVMAKLTSGEAEAGLVYATDVLAAGDAVQQIQLPAAAQVTTQYPVAVLRDAGQPALGQAFVDYLLSTPAQAVLSDAGFASLAG